jgi:hypothetical protein
MAVQHQIARFHLRALNATDEASRVKCIETVDAIIWDLEDAGAITRDRAQEMLQEWCARYAEAREIPPHLYGAGGAVVDLDEWRVRRRVGC